LRKKRFDSKGHRREAPGSTAAPRTEESRGYERRYFVYIVECSDASLYTGYTTDPERRLARHNRGGSKYTRSRLPVRMVYLEETRTQAEALAKERKVKSLSRKEKLLLTLRYAGTREGSFR